jgi:hypothetical protein
MIYRQTISRRPLGILSFIMVSLVLVACSSEPATNQASTLLTQTETAHSTETPYKTSTLMPITTTTLPTTQISIPASLIPFHDDFTDQSSGWDREGTSSSWEYGYAPLDQPRYYHVLLKEKMTKTFQNSHLGQYTDFSVEADGCVDTADVNGAWGVFFRQTSHGYYTFQVSAEGKYFLGKNLDGKFAWPISWVDSPFINKGANAVNSLRVECRSSEIRTYINGQFLTKINDGSFTSGIVGLSTSTLGQINAGLRFFGFRISEVSTPPIFVSPVPPSSTTETPTQIPITAPPGYEESLRAQIKLSTKTVDLVVLVLSGDIAKGQHVIDTYTKALPELEDLIGVPFPPDYTIRVQEYKRADIGNVAGRNMGMGGLQIADTNITYDPTLLHEISHYWFINPAYSESWLIESFATLYAYLEEVSLGDAQTAAQYKNMYFNWYYDNKDTMDIPLSQWTSKTTGNLNKFGYGKAAFFVFVLYDKAGAKAFKQLNQAAFSSQPVRVNSNSILPGLSMASGLDLSYLGSGWIFAGIAQPIN